MKIRLIVTASVVGLCALAPRGVLLAQPEHVDTVYVRRDSAPESRVVLRESDGEWKAEVQLIATPRAPGRTRRQCRLEHSEGTRILTGNGDEADALSFGDRILVRLVAASPPKPSEPEQIRVTCGDPAGDLTAVIVAAGGTLREGDVPAFRTGSDSDLPAVAARVDSVRADVQRAFASLVALAGIEIFVDALLLIGIGLLAFVFRRRLRRIVAGRWPGAPGRMEIVSSPGKVDPSEYVVGTNLSSQMNDARRAGQGSDREGAGAVQNQIGGEARELSAALSVSHHEGESLPQAAEGSGGAGELCRPADAGARSDPADEGSEGVDESAASQTMESGVGGGDSARRDGAEHEEPGTVSPSPAGDASWRTPRSDASDVSRLTAIAVHIDERLAKIEDWQAAFSEQVGALLTRAQTASLPTAATDASGEPPPSFGTIPVLNPPASADADEGAITSYEQFERVPQQLNDVNVRKSVVEAVNRALRIYAALEEIGTVAVTLSDREKGRKEFLEHVKFNRAWLSWLGIAIESGHWPMPFTINPTVHDEKSLIGRIGEQLTYARRVLKDPEQLVHTAEGLLLDKRTMGWIYIVNRERRDQDPDPNWLKLLREAVPLMPKHAPSGTVQWPLHQKLNEQAPGTTITRQIASGYEFKGQPLVPVLVSTENASGQPPQGHQIVPARAGDGHGA